MNLGIDASNLRQGGGQTHLRELLRAADPQAHGFGKVVVWGAAPILSQLSDRSWLVKRCPPLLQKGFISRALWQNYRLPSEARREDCDLLFVPGGSHGNGFHPVVTMCQNMLPFELNETMRFGFSFMTLKLLLLRKMQTTSFQNAAATIFLTNYARKSTLKVTGKLKGKSKTIPHGLSSKLRHPPKRQCSIGHYNKKNPYKILYVSIIDQYKHQWNVLDAVWSLRQITGWPVVVDFVGPAYPPALRRLRKTLHQRDPHGKWAKYRGNVEFSRLPQVYHKADLGLFASSCETISIILQEKMASGLPIASSNRGPMPEILGDGGLYFDPENPGNIAEALRSLIADVGLRRKLAKKSYAKAKRYSWKKCAEQTFAFLSKTAKSDLKKSSMQNNKL